MTPESIQALKIVAEHPGYKLAYDGEHYFAVPAPCVVEGPTLSQNEVIAYLADGEITESTLCFVRETLAEKTRAAVPREVHGLRATRGRLYGI